MVQVIEAIPPIIYSNVKTGEAFDLITGAIIAGIALGLLRDAFISKVPYYVAIIGGIVLAIYGGNNSIVKAIGLGLMAEGIYQVLSQYLTKSS